ncbi:MAG: tripartite tricarboxylate transporter substrate binding protein [Burkholderiaceae bacterium]
MPASTQSIQTPLRRAGLVRRRAARLAASVGAALFGMAALGAGAPAAAQDAYPSRPLQMIVPFPPGGPVDIVARAFARELEGKLQQRVVVVNRDGASTTIGMNALLAAPADGYTFVYGPVTALTVHLHWMKGLQFNADSFTPVCQTFENIFMLAARPDTPYRSLEALLAQGKQQPGKLTYGHPGIASSPHLAGAELFQRAGVSARDVPYRGETPLLPQLISGEIDLGVVTTGFATTHKLHPIAVFADKRLAAFPNTPTVKELGYAVTPSGYGGLFVRAGTGEEALAALEKGCRQTVADPLFKEAAQRTFQQADFLDRQQFRERIRADHASKEGLLKTVKFDR